MRAPLIALQLGLQSCVLHAPTEVHPPVPEGFADGGETTAPDRWWLAFDEPELSALIERAIGANLELSIAWARLAQAEAGAEEAGFQRLPSVNAEMGASYGRQSFGASGTVERATYSLSLAASYEVDLWGRVRSAARASDAELSATRDELETAAMSVAAQVAETWFALAEQRAQLRLLTAQRAISQTFLELVEARFGQGLVSALDVLQQRQQLAAQDRLLPPVRAQIAVLEHRLAVLLGLPPRTALTTTSTLPAIPVAPALGVPADLLEQRPDVRAARARVASADHRIAAAIADRLPALRLSANVGLQSNDLATLVDGLVFGVAGNLVAPLLDQPRRAARVDGARAELDRRLAELSRAVLTACLEVEDALVLGARQQDLIRELDRELALSRETLEEAKNRYLAGLADYLPVLSALGSTQVAERARLAATRQALSHRVQLFRALGGGWTRALERRSTPP